jgi:isoleucyl-tRNA synthetase
LLSIPGRKTAIDLMNTYKEHKEQDFSKIATEVLLFWKEHGIFEKSVSNRDGRPAWTFYEGPPSANGTPGIHHVMARTVKDIFCRFRTLQGFQVKRKGGWDTHGLPVELQVEKLLGISKDDIGKSISVEAYNQKCRETVMMYKDQWDDLTEKMGYWVDLRNPYITYEKNYIESLWWILKQLYEKKLLYKGFTIQPYSPSDGTGLSSHELNLPGCYKDVKDTSVVGQFKVRRNSSSEFLFKEASPEVYILAWTTTPWTLPSNTALAVGDKIEYVQVNTFNQYTHRAISVVLAKNLLEKNFPDKNKGLSLDMYKPGDKVIPFSVVQEFPGKRLTGIKYEQLMPYLLPLKDVEKAFQVVAGDFVTTEDGTGVVHISPTFGADDFKIARQYGIPPMTVNDESGSEVPVVDRHGRFITIMGKELEKGVEKYHIKTHRLYGPDDFYVKNYTNEDETNPDYKTTDVIISIILKEENKAFRVEKYEHSYPHSWRTDKPVLYYPLDAWFIKTTALKDKMVALNKTIIWKPESTGTGRFGNWLENLVDWNLSRSRFWGTPLPIWRTKDNKEEICIGSIEELKSEMAKSVGIGFQNADSRIITHEFDLHKPYVDEIILASPSGKPMYREPDLIDVWFDSGAMPYAQWHYPFENRDIFEKSYPADFIAEGVDQTRGWFFTLHAIAAMLSESSEEIKAVNLKNGNPGVAFKSVISNGLVLDKNGNKMSKSKGNVVNPFETIQRFGPDVVRWYMIENANPWENLKFDMEGIAETQRRFFGTLLNTYSFFALYANIDGFSKGELDAVPWSMLKPLDKWITSKLQTLIFDVTTAYEELEPTKAARAIEDFVNDQLSNWYVRLNRKRFWQPVSGSAERVLTEDKRAAYETLYECIMVVSQLMSPIAPFYSEYLYRNLTNSGSLGQHESIHLTDLALAESGRMDRELEVSMEYAQKISSLVHSIRKNSKIKVRTPLQKILLPVLDEKFVASVKVVEDIIKAEVNVKSIEYIDDTSGLLIKNAKPNFAKLGKAYGPRMKEISAVINCLTKEEIQLLERKIGFSKGGFDLMPDDVLISSEDVAGWAVASDGTITVALDITVTEELKKEGFARDFVNRIQHLRKEMGLDVLDKIEIEVEQNGGMVTSALMQFKEYISTETQALSLEVKNSVAAATAVEVDEFKVKVRIEIRK